MFIGTAMSKKDIGTCKCSLKIQKLLISRFVFNDFYSILLYVSNERVNKNIHN